MMISDKERREVCERCRDEVDDKNVRRAMALAKVKKETWR